MALTMLLCVVLIFAVVMLISGDESGKDNDLLKIFFFDVQR
jgi:hypothetical protein